MQLEQTSRLTGRPPGMRNRNVVNARRAIAQFVESNIPRFNGWLQQVAEGIPKRDRDGRPLVDAYGSTVWLVKPDPLGALRIVADVTEYHLPRLSRTDIEVAATVESRLSAPTLASIDSLPTVELKRLLLERNPQLAAKYGITLDTQPEDIVDAELVEAPLPSWITGA